MKLAFTTLAVASSSPLLEDDAVMLSVASVRESMTSEAGLSTLIDFARADSPTKASALLQEFAASTIARGEAVDDVTKEKLKEIGAQLTNNTWMALEQSHRRDQDLLDKHWRAIKECGDKHIAHLQQDVDGLEVVQVRTHETDMVKCRGLPNHTNPGSSLLQESPLFNGYVGEDGQRYFKHVSAYYNDPSHESLMELKNRVCDKCSELEAFLDSLEKSKPNCDKPAVLAKTEPQATTPLMSYVDTDLNQYFENLQTFADENLGRWESLRDACAEAREEYKLKDEHCDQEQSQYESAFCAYRQGLHSTCAEYQGCHILTEAQYTALINDVLYAADSRKIDWKAIHKIACYIKVLVSEGTNEERTTALHNCESGDLNTLATILTGFNESNYLSLIIPEISQNVSCWDLEVPPLIDFKECDMSSVEQFPCTDTWNKRYAGLESPAECTSCPTLPEHVQYHIKQDHRGARLEEYGGGWMFVNEIGKSNEDMDDITAIQPNGYYLPSYNMKGLRWNEVLVQRVSPNWCDSWGRQSSKWVEEDGASMCVQSDHEHVYCMSNHNDEHTWRQAPVSHFGAICSKEGDATCECWPHQGDQSIESMQAHELDGKLCFAHGEGAHGPTLQNVLAPGHVDIASLEEDGSVVKISFKGEEKTGVLRVGNYGSFLDGVGCGAVTPVKYRVFVRCLGCTTERADFHTKDGAQFNGAMTMGKITTTERSDYTYEAWFRSPLEGHFAREIFGGAFSGLTLVNEGEVRTPCQYFGDGGNERTTYQLTAGNANAVSSFCFQKGAFYHVAVTKSSTDGVHLYVNGREYTVTGDDVLKASTLTRGFAGGFTDGGQLFNVRIWDVARSPFDLVQDAFVTDKNLISTNEGLAHWWPLTDNIKDVITGALLEGDAPVRYAPIWCSDLEATGMRGC
jgi:hypothetical protein